MGACSSSNSDPTIKNYLFDAVGLTKNADIDKYSYSGYGIGFGKGPTQGLAEHLLTAEKMYSINFTLKIKEILLKLAL